METGIPILCPSDTQQYSGTKISTALICVGTVQPPQYPRVKGTNASTSVSAMGLLGSAPII